MKRRLIACIACVSLAFLLIAALAAGLVWPQATGTSTKKDGKLTVDVGGASDGYLMIKGESNSKRYKLRIQYGDTTLTYDINNKGNYECFPLQMGSGTYTVTLYLNSSGKKYASAGAVKVSASLNDEQAAFLIPNQYVNYTASTSAVALGEEICAGLSTEREKFEAIRAYIGHNFMYDYVKAITVQAGTLPDIEGCMSSKMGICQDLAATAVCMLRTQGVPAKLVIGYIDKQYHAWVVVMIDGQEILYDPTAELGGVSGGSYSVERFY